MAILAEIRECLPLLEKAYQDCIHIKKDKKEYIQKTNSFLAYLFSNLSIVILLCAAYLFWDQNCCKKTLTGDESNIQNNSEPYALLFVLLSWSIFFVSTIKNSSSFLMDTIAYLDLRFYMNSAKITLDGWMMHPYLTEDEHERIKNLLLQLNIAEDKEVGAVIAYLKQEEQAILLRNKQRLAFLSCGIRPQNPIHHFFKMAQGSEKEMAKLIFQNADLGQCKI